MSGSSERACFEGYLRLAEGIGATIEVVLVLPESKTGLNQSGIIHRDDWLDLTRQLSDRPLHCHRSLVNISAHKFRGALPFILKKFGVKRVHFTLPHSLRQVGPPETSWWVFPLLTLCCDKIASRYIRQGRALLVKPPLPKQL